MPFDLIAEETGERLDSSFEFGLDYFASLTLVQTFAITCSKIASRIADS
jgi:hypothetical protein